MNSNTCPYPIISLNEDGNVDLCYIPGNGYLSGSCARFPSQMQPSGSVNLSRMREVTLNWIRCTKCQNKSVESKSTENTETKCTECMKCVGYIN